MRFGMERKWRVSGKSVAGDPSEKAETEDVRKSATAFRDVQRVLFNRSVHKPVHKGVACAIHAVFINRCTSCTTFVAGRGTKKSSRGALPAQVE
jgi:hypothetical protein